MNISMNAGLSNKDEYCVVGLSITGDGKLENQDNFAVYADSKQIIVAVADGLGSAPLSKDGSMKVVNAAISVLCKTDDYTDLGLKVFQTWKSSITGELNPYDTTCKFVKITCEKAYYGGIGDGWIAINTDNKLVELVSNNVFANHTSSILSFDLVNSFSINEVGIESIKNILISTDGFSEDFEKIDGLIFLEDVYEQIESDISAFQSNLENTLNNWPVITNKDDKTVVFIHKRPIS